MKGKLIPFAPLGTIVCELQTAYDRGLIKGVIEIIRYHDDTFALAVGGEFTYIEKLGFLEAAKDVVNTISHN